MPYISAITPIKSRPCVIRQFTGLTAVPTTPIISGPSVGLFVTGPSPITPDSLEADFIEPTFDSYAKITLTLAVGPIILPSNVGLGMSQSVTWIVGGAGGAATIVGYFVVDTSGLVMAEYFATPIQMVNPGDFIQLDVNFPFQFAVPVT